MSSYISKTDSANCTNVLHYYHFNDNMDRTIKLLSVDQCIVFARTVLYIIINQIPDTKSIKDKILFVSECIDTSDSKIKVSKSSSLAERIAYQADAIIDLIYYTWNFMCKHNIHYKFPIGISNVINTGKIKDDEFNEKKNIQEFTGSAQSDLLISKNYVNSMKWCIHELVELFQTLDEFSDKNKIKDLFINFIKSYKYNRRFIVNFDHDNTNRIKKLISINVSSTCSIAKTCLFNMGFNNSHYCTMISMVHTSNMTKMKNKKEDADGKVLKGVHYVSADKLIVEFIEKLIK